MTNAIHRSLAVLILLFVAIHLCNHLVGIAGADSHIAFMNWARKIYRNPIIEPVLLSALFAQALLGLYFVYRSWGKRIGFFQKVQVVSGCYLVFFLLAHVSATLSARDHLDTNFYFAAAGIHAEYVAYYFVPYYFLAVLAIFAHVAAAAHWFLIRSSGEAAANRIGALIFGVGMVIAGVIVAALSGQFFEVIIPAEYGVMFGEARHQ